jgi:phosphatidylethanolamine N-methyltransferase
LFLIVVCVASVALNPIFWNIAARSEYSTHILTKLAGGNRKLGCYGLAATIFSLGLIRDHLYQVALEEQPILPVLDSIVGRVAGLVSFSVGSILVLSSMWALGITGTYLGDYFGILMEKRVNSFPFNVTNNPMYYGSFLTFLGYALWYARPAGIAISGFVLIMYLIALRFEEPFTGEIYAKRDRERQKKGL